MDGDQFIFFEGINQSALVRLKDIEFIEEFDGTTTITLKDTYISHKVNNEPQYSNKMITISGSLKEMLEKSKLQTLPLHKVINKGE